MEKKTKNVFSVLVIAFVLVIGTANVMLVVEGEDEYDRPPFEALDEDASTVVLVNIDSEQKISELSGYGEIIDHYGRNVLIRTDQEKAGELVDGHGAQILDYRNEISVKGHTFDTSEGLPELDSKLTIDSYESGTEGLYIVDMLGPVNPEWRTQIEKEGAEVINYQPNYAYEVIMTPEQAEDIEELEFVDWVGIYQPEFKIHPNLDEALDKDMPVSVRLRPGFESSTLKTLESRLNVLGAEYLNDDGLSMTVDVDSERLVEALALENDVYYISPSIEPELHAEMDAQQIGGGMWFMDDEYETRTDLDPEPREGDPQEPYRKHGDYGAYINQIGYSGEDTTVAVADTGLGDGTVGDAGHEDFTGRVIGGYGFGEDEENWADGHYHGTAVTGLVAGDTYHGTGDTWDEHGGDMEYYMGQGLAYEAEIFSTKIFDDAGGFMPTAYYPIVEEPVQRSDAYIHSNSWGAETGGSYSDSDEIFDQAVRDADRDTDENRPMVITTSAGNAGPGDQTIGSPATAKNVITVGGNQPYNPTYGQHPEDMYGSSSRGWTEDNRIKPDVIAPSESVITQNTPLDDGGYVEASGTSFGNPLVTGASTIVVDWYEENHGETPSPAMVRSILINTANELDPEVGDTRGHIPNQDEGWGVPDLSKLEYPIDDSIGFEFSDQETLLETGEEEFYTINPDDTDEPLKITLTWTDEHALEGDSAGGSPTLKNNLDLEVETPGGEIIRGNSFDLSGDGESDDGFTYPEAEVMDDFDYNDDGWDDVNNVQNVYISPDQLESGSYTVRIIGTNIPEDANNDGEANQDFALTAYNVPDVELPPKDAELTLDRDEYAGEDIVEISLADYDLMEEGTYDINITSVASDGTELDEEWVTLVEDETNPGYFEGDMETTTDSHEEGLYVEHDAEITAWYYDEDPGGETVNSEETNNNDEINKVQSSISESSPEKASSAELILEDNKGYTSDIDSDGTISEESISYDKLPGEQMTNREEKYSLYSSYYSNESSSTYTPSPDGDYEVRDPIEIEGDDEFHDEAEEEDWPGDGTEDDPYIIENYEIDGDGHETSIEIVDVSLYFELRDNYVYDASDHGMYLENVTDVVIANNTANNNGENGIYLFDAHDSEIVNNSVDENIGPFYGGHGIHLELSTGNKITENHATSDGGLFTGHGITLTDSTENTVKNNLAEMGDAWAGIYLDGANNNIIAENDIDDSGRGIFLEWSADENTVINNTVSNCSSRNILLIRDSDDNVVKNNHVENVGRWEIDIYWGASNNYVANNTVNPDGTGIRMHEALNNVLVNNTILPGDVTGIRIVELSEGNIIKENKILENDIGVNIDDSNENLIFRNLLIENDKQGFDGGLDNSWHHGDPAEGGEGGNYWSDYVGDNRGDGIGDEPYYLHHDTNQDNYPWVDRGILETRERDVAVSTVISPTGIVPDESIEVLGLIANFGEEDEEDVPVSYEIWSDENDQTWSDTVYVDLETEEYKEISFGEWTPPEERDDYNINISVDLEEDEYPDNDYIEEKFEVRDIHDVGVSDIKHPGEGLPEHHQEESEWEWLYEGGPREEAVSGLGITQPMTWWAGMRLDTEEYIEDGHIFTELAFYDFEEEGGSARAQIATIDEWGGVDEFVGHSEEYDLSGAGWTELELEEPVEIQEEEYYILVEMDDFGEDYFPIGVNEPYVEDAGMLNFGGNPKNPEDWQTTDDVDMNYSFNVEVEITDYEEAVFNETQPVEGVIENFGNVDQTDVLVESEIVYDETGEIEFSDETTVDLEAHPPEYEGETVIADFGDWTPSHTGYYTVNMTTDLENDENPENDYYEISLYVVPIEIDFESKSIDAPEEPIYQYEQEISGTVKNVGNYPTDSPVEMKIEKVNESELIFEDFLEGLPEDWTIEDKDGSGYTWEFDADDEAMKVTSEVDSQNDVLWTETIDATDATHRFMVEFYSEFEGDVSRDLLVSTDGGETSQRVKTNIPEGEVSYDLTDWVAGEDEVLIGWEYFSEEIENEEYWLIDEVKVTGENLSEPDYIDQAHSPELQPGESGQVEFANWIPEEDLPSDFLFTMVTQHEEDENLENTVITERMFVDYNLPPDEPEDPSPYDGEDGVSHQPEFGVNVSDPNSRNMDITFYLLNETGDEIENKSLLEIESESRVTVEFPIYLESESTYQWYVEAHDGDEITTSPTWSFDTYESEPVWNTATARINAEPPEPVENLHVDWDADVWEVEANELTWDASPDDGAGEDDTNHYVIYRSDSEDGPWNESTKIDTVDADGSEDYTYMDEGMADDGVQWHYVVRAVDRQDNMEINEDTVSEKLVPTASEPNPGDGDEVEGLEQTISADINSPTEEPLEVKFYEGETQEVIAEFDGIVDERLETDYVELNEEDMSQYHHWFVVASYEEYNVGSINPEPEGWGFYLKDTVDPVADAGEDIEAYQGDTITLDGTGSTDNVGIDEYEWTIEDPTGNVATIYEPQFDYKLEHALYYDVELTVYDEAGNSDTDTIEIYAIDTENPVADAGQSGYTRVDLDYTFDGTGSTDNVEIVNYTWSIEGISGSAEGYEETVYGETVDYVFPYQGTYDITLEVYDAEGNSDTDKISVVVHPALEAFEITNPEEDYETIDKDTITVEWEGHEHMDDLTYEIRLNYGDWDEIGTDTEYTFVGLEDGTHVVQVRAIHETGDKYTETRIFEIDTIEEELTIIEPEDGVESLTYEDDFTIAGETDPELDVYINEVEVDVDEEGEFEYETTLVEGQNVFKVIAEHDGDEVVETTVYALYLPQIQEMQDDIDDMQNDIDENRDDIEDLFDITDDLEIDIGELEDELHAEVDRLEDALDENVTALEDAIDENRTDLIDMIDANITYLEGELEDVEDDIDDLWTAVDDINTTIGELEDDIDENRDDIDDLIDITNELELDMIDLEHELESEITRLETALNENVTALEHAINDNADDIGSAQDDIADIQDNIGEINDELSYINNDIGLIYDELEYLEGRIDDLETNQDTLEDDLNDLRNDMEQRIADLEDEVDVDLDELEESINDRIDGVEADIEEQSDGTGDSMNLAIVGIILAILAIIIAIAAMYKGGKSEEVSAEHEDESNTMEEEIEEEEIFEEEELDEDL